jgi:hypothetical protein
LSLFVPIDIDQNDRGVKSFVDKELAESSDLFLTQCLFGTSVGSYGTIDVIPEIGGSLLCRPFNVLAAHQFVVVMFADAGSNAKDESSFSAGTNTSEGALIDIACLTTTVAFLLQSLYADQGGDIPSLAELLSDFVCQEGAVGEELEVAVMMLLEEIEETLIHQRFASQDAKKLGSMTFTLSDDTVNLLHRQAFPSTLTHPTTAACQIAGLSDGNHVEGREERFTLLLPLLKVTHIPQVRPAEVPTELPQQPNGGLSEHPPADFHQ